MRADAVTSSAPGRVTLVGEHTDYNEGRSLGVATTQRTRVHARERADGTVEVASDALGTARVPLTASEGPAFAVLAAALARAAACGGARLEVTTELPVGAGLSSSASYAVAVALSLGVAGDPVAIAKACQLAEREAGSDVGLLDQLVVLTAKARHAVAIDFSSLEVADVALHPAIALSVVDSGERRQVGASPYAERRDECGRAAAAIGPLGRATLDDLDALDDPVLRRRAHHVVTECARVDDARRLLASGDLAGLGLVLDASHASLRDDFEASTPRVEVTRDALRAEPGVVGVRLTGAGFGGCLLVAHAPGSRLDVGGRWSTPLPGGEGAWVSAPR